MTMQYCFYDVAKSTQVYDKFRYIMQNLTPLPNPETKTVPKFMKKN
jgi:hypothetical protein